MVVSDSKKENFTRFITHPKHDRIYFDERAKCFRLIISDDIEMKLPGIRDNLKEIFFYDYEYKRKKGDGSTGVSSASEGIERGKTVHDELMDYANLPKKEFIKLHPRLHKYTIKAIQALKEWKFRAMCAEICINSDHFATKFDNVSTDINGRFILIEWKTGMDSYIKRGNASMKGILEEKFSNCPLNQAFLQLLLTKSIIEYEYNTKVHDSYVVHIHKEGVDLIEIPDDMMELQREIYEYYTKQVIIIQEAKRINKQKKKEKKKKNGTYNKKRAGKRKFNSFFK